MATESKQQPDVIRSSNTEQTSNAEQTSNWLSTFRNVAKSVTIEPMVFLLAIAMVMSELYMGSLFMYKICRVNFKNDSQTCHSLSNYSTLEVEVQKVATNYQLYSSILGTIPSLIYILFVGSWSDKFGRKFPLVFQLVTFILASLIPILTYEIEELPPLFLLLIPIISSFSGGMAGADMIFFSYLSDITDEKTRTLRIGIVDGAFSIGAPIGTLLAGFLLKNWGYTSVFGTGVVLTFFCLLYTILFIKESLPSEIKDRNDPSQRAKSFFNFQNCRESFKTFVKTRTGNKRRQLWILSVCNCIVSLATVEMMYLYARRKFQWDDEIFSYYVTAGSLAGFFAYVVLLPFIIRCIKLKDYYIFLIGLIGVFVQYNVIAFSSASWMLFAVYLILVQSYTFTPLRSLLTQCVDVDEVGKLFSVLAIFECLVPLLKSSIFTQIYNATITTFPGTVYLVGAGLIFICIIIMGYVIYDIKTSSYETLEETPNIENNYQNNQIAKEPGSCNQTDNGEPDHYYIK